MLQNLQPNRGQRDQWNQVANMIAQHKAQQTAEKWREKSFNENVRQFTANQDRLAAGDKKTAEYLSQARIRFEREGEKYDHDQAIMNTTAIVGQATLKASREFVQRPDGVPDIDNSMAYWDGKRKEIMGMLATRGIDATKFPDVLSVVEKGIIDGRGQRGKNQMGQVRNWSMVNGYAGDKWAEKLGEVYGKEPVVNWYHSALDPMNQGLVSKDGQVALGQPYLQAAPGEVAGGNKLAAFLAGAPAVAGAASAAPIEGLVATAPMVAGGLMMGAAPGTIARMGAQATAKAMGYEQTTEQQPLNHAVGALASAGSMLGLEKYQMANMAKAGVKRSDLFKGISHTAKALESMAASGVKGGSAAKTLSAKIPGLSKMLNPEQIDLLAKVVGPKYRNRFTRMVIKKAPWLAVKFMGKNILGAAAAPVTGGMSLALNAWAVADLAMLGKDFWDMVQEEESKEKNLIPNYNYTPTQVGP